MSSGPTHSASGTSATVINPYYSTGQYNYAVKHNPMAFFSDTQTQNVYPLTQFATDLSQHTFSRYNWITPNQYNDQHSALSAGFTYHGVAYTGDQAAIAQGDNFLAILVPKIMATPEYQDHGIIIIRWDESEGGDTTSYTVPEILISPLARGNAYASSLEMSHSTDIKTVEQIFGLSYLSNAIPSGETRAAGSGYNNVATVNDLTDLFRPLPVAPDLISGRIVGGGSFELTFGGPTSQTYQVRATEDLTSSLSNWEVLTSAAFGATNAVFTDDDATNHPARFYRIESP